MRLRSPVIAFRFHDIDLSAERPTTVNVRFRHHPIMRIQVSEIVTCSRGVGSKQGSARAAEELPLGLCNTPDRRPQPVTSWQLSPDLNFTICDIVFALGRQSRASDGVDNTVRGDVTDTDTIA